jgi:hypothetical protein
VNGLKSKTRGLKIAPIFASSLVEDLRYWKDDLRFYVDFLPRALEAGDFVAACAWACCCWQGAGVRQCGIGDAETRRLSEEGGDLFVTGEDGKFGCFGFLIASSVVSHGLASGVT